jgi:hypothetical protein
MNALYSSSAEGAMVCAWIWMLNGLWARAGGGFYIRAGKVRGLLQMTD